MPTTTSSRHLRTAARAALAAAVAVLLCGCDPGRNADRGLAVAVRFTAGGKPVVIAPGEDVGVVLLSSAGKRYILFPQPDGAFVWPRPDLDGPVLEPGSYRVSVSRKNRPSKSAAPSVPERLTVEAGKTEYTIDVGSW
ncbi:hypothetical protein [Gemmata sp.]|uniref:hypothetical protein n=1 Tax=Gemmata sp. TaxID=1914242 RepID=UPI003F6F749D